MLLMQAQENGDLALNVDNVFQADDCDAFNSDVDEAPMAQTMFMANLSTADPATDEARPSYDSDILSEQGVVEHVWKMKLKIMVDNAIGLRHLTSKQEDPLCFERIVPTSFCFPLHVSHVASDKHTTYNSWSPSVLCLALQLLQIYPIQ
nr:hypothetical protein [Tanacetum cinerariifolium]